METKKRRKPKRPVWQRHHMHYPGEEAGERTVMIRKGVHACITIMRRFKKLTMDEVEAIQYECNRKLEVNNDIEVKENKNAKTTENHEA